ncbi:MAG: signal peptidase I [Clostridiales bacterium]|nr:signal peptidase I [Clostridiales bacterium]
MIGKCLNGIFWMVILTAMAGAALVSLPYLFNIRPRIVLSGSMEPEIPVGSLAYIAGGVSPKEIKTGDVIAYKMGESMQVLHRVIETDQEKKWFQTKGDANQQADLGRVEFSRYQGKALFHIPYAGYVVKFMQTGNHMLWVALGIAGLGAADEILRKKEGGQKLWVKRRKKKGMPESFTEKKEQEKVRESIQE